MLKHVLILTTAAALTTFTTSVRAQSHDTGSANLGSSTTKADSKTTRFIKEAAEGNDAEIAMAEVGIQKAQNADLKNFCEQLKKDHTEANNQLRPIAQKYGVSVEQELKGKSHREMTKLEKETAGAKFDQRFAEDMLQDHQKDIQMFQRAANEVQETDVKQYAQSMLPKLEQHFQTAQNVAKAVGVDQSTISKYSRNVPTSVGGTSEEPSTSKGAGARDLKNDSTSPNSQSGQ